MYIGIGLIKVRRFNAGFSNALVKMMLNSFGNLGFGKNTCTSEFQFREKRFTYPISRYEPPSRAFCI